MKWYLIGILFSLLMFMMQGVLADSLISFEQDIKPDPYAADDLISRVGTMNIPAGMGIMTTNEIIEPYWAPQGDILPVRVEFSQVNATGPYADIEILGMDLYQFGNEVYGLSFSNGAPLNIITKYLVNSSNTVPYYLLLRNTLDKGDTIHDFNLIYSAEYKPLYGNLSVNDTRSLSGLYNTNIGELNLTFSFEKPGMFPFIRGVFADGNIISGTLNGPVWSGLWSSNETVAENDPSIVKVGNFMVVFEEGGSSFSGTIGKQHSCSNAGSFTGNKES